VKPDARGDGVVVEVEGGDRVAARDVVVATNSPIHTRVTYHTKIAPYRTYVLGLRIRKGALPSLIWDTEDPYHYVRTAPSPHEGEEVLLVGGEDHKTGQARDVAERYERLERWARERFPSAGEAAWRWSGQVMESVDAVGFNGKSAHQDHVWVITGDSGNGLTNGTLGAKIVAGGIVGREPPWASAFDPARKPLREAGEWLKENANVALQFADWFRRGEVPDVDAIAPGDGAVIARGLAQVAVYRDPAGHLRACSAACTHAGCVVAWNGAEKSWDCPCHGSRFDTFGKVLNGPAVKGLESVVVPAKK
jgi:Rieske Fe-S protein